MKPIIFSSTMVRAILRGEKTQTRRIMKPQPKEMAIPLPMELSYFVKHLNKEVGKGYTQIYTKGPLQGMVGPKTKYDKGDILYVRESFNYFGNLDPGYLSYKATYPHDLPAGIENVPDISQVTWKPSIHMPFKIARIFLEVTDIKAQRLQDISEEDALAEGVDHRSMAHPVIEFQLLWQSIYGEKSWEENPYVFAYTFKKVQI